MLMGCLSNGLASPTGRGNSPPDTASHATPAQNTPVLRYLVHGIIENTQWPSPTTEVKLCLAGSPGLLESLQAKPLHSRYGRVAIQSVGQQEKATALQDCSVLLIGQEIPQNTALNWVLSLQKWPVITIRENPEQCSSGAMICLYTPESKAPTFDINLDLVSRSGVRLNSMVLTLTNHLPSDLLPALKMQ